MKKWLKRFGFAGISVCLGLFGWSFARPLVMECPEMEYVTVCIDQYAAIPDDLVQMIEVIERKNERDNDLLRPIVLEHTDFGYSDIAFRLQGLWGSDFKIHSQEDILRFKLGTGEYAGKSWGLVSAADEYFGKSVGDLTKYESLFLLTAYLNPDFHNPYLHPDMFQECFGLLARLADRYGIFVHDEGFDALAAQDWLMAYYETDILTLKNVAEQKVMPHAFTPKQEVDAFLRGVVDLESFEGHILVGNIQTGKIEALVSDNIAAMFAKHEPREMMLPILYTQAFAQGMYPSTEIDLDAHLMKGKEEFMYWNKDAFENANFPYSTDLRTAFMKKDLPVFVQLIDFIGMENIPDLLGPYGLRSAFHPIASREGGYQDGKANFFQMFKAFSFLASEGHYFEYQWDEESDIRDWYGMESETLMSIETVNKVSPRWATIMGNSLLDESRDGMYKMYSGQFADEDYEMHMAYNDVYVIGIFTDKKEHKKAKNIERYVFDFLWTRDHFYTAKSYALHHFPDKEQDPQRIGICAQEQCRNEYLPPFGTPLVVALTEDRIVYADDPHMIESDRFRVEYLVEYMDDTTVENEHNGAT